MNTSTPADPLDALPQILRDAYENALEGQSGWPWVEVAHAAINALATKPAADPVVPGDMRQVDGKWYVRLETGKWGLATDQPAFALMVAGRDAEARAESRLEEILGVELVGIGFDDYDGSFEIYPMPEVADVEVSEEMHAQILALGCSRYWINFKDGTERYCRGDRKSSSSQRWERFDKGVEARRAAESPAEPVAYFYRFHTDDSLQGRPNVRKWTLAEGRPDASIFEHAEVRLLVDGVPDRRVKVHAYYLVTAPDIKIERTQKDGREKWAVRSGAGDCLNKSGAWEWEPQPSSRDEAFLARCRFDSAQEATEAALAVIP